MKPLGSEIKFSVVEINRVAAKISIQGPIGGRWLTAECFEVGVDGSKPDSPLAVAGPDMILRIGTPFLWSPDAQPLYAVEMSEVENDTTNRVEIQFGFDAEGKIVVTAGPRKIAGRSTRGNPQLPSIFVVGDSTAYSNGANQRGWGDELGKFLDASKFNVRNRARPGRSTRSYRNEGLWGRVLAELKPKDLVLIQFGHNDADKLAEDRCRGVLPGTGAETSRVTLPDGSEEEVHTFGWYLRQFIAEAKARGATPVLLSLTPKNIWGDGKLVRPQNEYGQWAAAVAAETGVVFIDATGAIANRYDALGQDQVQPLFCNQKDNVHTSRAGAQINAAVISEQVKKR